MLTSLGVAGLLGIIRTFAAVLWTVVLWRRVLDLGWGWLPEIRL